MLDHVLKLSKGVSDHLQKEDLDVVTGCDRVEDLLVALRMMRNEEKFQKFWTDARGKCEKLGISLESQTPQRQRKVPRRLDDRPETAHQFDAIDFYRINLYFSVSKDYNAHRFANFVAVNVVI